MSGAGRTDPGGSTGGTRFLENLAYLVPGYRGYKEKDLRREEDARLRGRVLAKLQMVKALLEERLGRLSEQSLDSGAEALGRRLRRVEGVADAVRYAPYGFSGFFDAEEIREETLEKILETDLLLFQDLDETVERLRGATFPPRTKTTFTAFLNELDADIERIETRLVARDKILGDR
jgi:two-component sensor histidine kinase